MAQQLRGPKLGSQHTFAVRLTRKNAFYRNNSNSTSRGSNSHFWPPQAPALTGIYSHTDTHACTKFYKKCFYSRQSHLVDLGVFSLL